MNDYLATVIDIVFYSLAFIMVGVAFVVAVLDFIGHIWPLYEFLFVIVIFSMVLIVLTDSLRTWLALVR